MRKLSLAAVVCAAAALAPPPAGAASNATAPSVKGRQYFMNYCASCHGTGGRGNGPVARELRKPPSDLTRIAKRRGGRFPEAEIARFIDGRSVVPAHGTREMPVWGTRFGNALGGDSAAEEMTRGRIGTLVDYLKTLQVK
jgi:mono/diheme cytochrome c family protein